MQCLFFNCNIWQDASHRALLGRSGGVGEKWGSSLSLVACEDCLEVCFVGLVVEWICVWCLAIAAIFMGFGQARAKMCGGCLKVIDWGWRCNSKKGALFIGKTCSHCVMLYCETLLQVLLGIYCKRFYWIPLFATVVLRV